jgi:hypothetical protein
MWRMLDVPSANEGVCVLPFRLLLDGLAMIRTAIRRLWPGLLALAWLANHSQARADGPLPISTCNTFICRFDVKIGPSAFCRPAGPWYSYFPIDPNLLAQPRVAAYPNWPNPYPPAGSPPPRPLPGQLPPPSPTPNGMGYYPTPAAPYAYGGVAPVSYYGTPSAPGYWYMP